jgi:hypothetical protein
MRSVYLVGLLICASGCAHSAYHVGIESLGANVDPYPFQKAALDMSWADAADIEVQVGVMPEGVEYANGALNTNSSAWDIVAKVYTIQGSGRGVLRAYAEDEKWKNTYCGVQTPLAIASLFVWMAVPTYYPCFIFEGNSPRSISERRGRLISTLQTGAKAVGGNLLVVTDIGSTTTISLQNGREVGRSTKEMTAAVGYVLREKRTGDSALPSAPGH